MDKLAGGANAILLLLTAMAIGGTLLVSFIGWRRHETAIVKTFLGGAALVAVAYAGGVIAASGTSSETTIGQGDIKWFCGFYLDCHLGMSVERTEKLAALQTPAGSLKAKGRFQVVTVRLHNSAKNPNIDMLLYRPDARIVDASGREYRRSSDAESLLDGTSRPGPLATETRVSHEPVDATLVFDLPNNIQQPRLMVTEGWIVDRVIELGLIGDENSIFHRRALFAMDESDSRTAWGTAQ